MMSGTLVRALLSILYYRILASHGIQKGDYEVELYATFPMLIFDE